LGIFNFRGEFSMEERSILDMVLPLFAKGSKSLKILEKIQYYSSKAMRKLEILKVKEA
jgi:hypothetical protein